MIFTTLVPTRRNDGSPVSQAELNDILMGLWQRFGGCSIEGPIKGHWIDPKDGRHYEDESLKVWSAIEANRLPDAEEAVREIGRRLGQEAMYFEVSNPEVKFL